MQLPEHMKLLYTWSVNTQIPATAPNSASPIPQGWHFPLSVAAPRVMRGHACTAGLSDLHVQRAGTLVQGLLLE